MAMRTLRTTLWTLVALAAGLKFALGTATPETLACYLLLLAVLMLIPAGMIGGDTVLGRGEVSVFTLTVACCSTWMLTFDGGESQLPWIAFAFAWLIGLGSYLIAVRVKHRDGGVVTSEVLEALAGWPAMRQFNTSVTAPAAAPDLRPPGLRLADMRPSGMSPAGTPTTIWQLTPDGPGDARRRLREQGFQPVRRSASERGSLVVDRLTKRSG